MADVRAPSIPPTIQILLAEEFPKDATKVRKRFSKSTLLRDLHNQALWSVQHFQYYAASPDEFGVVPAPSLDPLSRIRPCPHPECIVLAATDLARTLGVYADVVVLPDNITPLVGAMAGNALSEEDAYQLFTMTFALKVLQPLIESGVVRFFFGEQVMCRRHMEMFDRGVTRTARSTAKAVFPDVQIARTDSGFAVVNETLFAPLRGYTFLANSRAAKERLRSDAELKRRALAGLAEQLRLAIRETALEMFSAENAGATYVADSELVSRALNTPTLRNFVSAKPSVETLATLKLPWVADLDIHETLELREATGPALRRLRALFRKSREVGTLSTIAADLRTEATEIEAELLAMPLARNRQFRKASAALGLSFSLIAAAVGTFPASAIGAGGTLLSLLALLHDKESRERQDVSKLQYRPGYVLLRAKELLARRLHT